MQSTYSIEALEYGEDPSIGSVCAVAGQVIYECPEHAGMPIEEARKIAEELSVSGIEDSTIEKSWILLS